MELHYKNLSLDDIVYLDDNGVQCTEVWKDIPDYEGYYQISDLGRVKSLKREIWNGSSYFLSNDRLIKQNFNVYGYLICGLHYNGSKKTFTIHKLVAIAFLNHIPCGYEKVIDHISNDRLDNKLSNLQLITQRENTSKDKKNKKTNFTGVGLCENGNSFTSYIRFKDKSINLGRFDTEEEASEYYQNALKSIENGEEIVVKRAVFSSENLGVYFCKTRMKWMTTLKRKHIGIYDSENEAYLARENYIKNLEKGIEKTPKRKLKISKYLGVSFNKDNSWKSYYYCRKIKKKKYIGYFKTELEAFEARENYIKNLNLQE